MKVIKCQECGHTTTKIEFDGYPFGDRLLEGVMFTAELLPDGSGVKVTGVTAEAEAYMAGLNKPHWIQRAQEYADSMYDDIFCGCPECEFDLVLSEDVVEI